MSSFVCFSICENYCTLSEKISERSEESLLSRKDKKETIVAGTGREVPHRYLNSSGARCAVEERFVSL